jgi:uncharacterized protein YodC (DUF2158 family)
MENQFKIGTVVSLKSGSPKLTVTAVSEDKKTIDLKYWDKSSNQFLTVESQDFQLFNEVAEER